MYSFMLKCSLALGIVAGLSSCADVDADLNLADSTNSFSYFPQGVTGRIGYGLRTGYGMGGYGDANRPGSNFTVCSNRAVDRRNCTAESPNNGPLQWRFIKNVGWRKFSPYDAARKDWWDYKKTLYWPFNRLRPDGSFIHPAY